ncbi:MAG: hypothetical protein B6I38_11910 [Anaerolineaceae bacterium 4572_5.1]|nr:MAG: hypothetical protein B6I38_11910 [Anaerolineaceae bacterium 4572_5.1]
MPPLDRDALFSIEKYCQTIYTFLDNAPSIRGHTVRIYSRGAWVGVLEGKIEFEQGFTLRVYERLDFMRRRIMAYSYEAWQDQQQLYWYDPQEHPNDASLASSFPHHKHTPPNIKRHRIPAPELSFNKANIPFLVQEIEQLLPPHRLT